MVWAPPNQKSWLRLWCHPLKSSSNVNSSIILHTVDDVLRQLGTKRENFALLIDATQYILWLAKHLRNYPLLQGCQPAGHIWPAKLFCMACKVFLRGTVDFLMERLTILWQIERRSKPNPSVLFIQNQFGFAAKTFFLVFTYFWGQILMKLSKISSDLRRRPSIISIFRSLPTFGTDIQNIGRSGDLFCTANLQFIWTLIVVKMHVARNNFFPVNVTRTSKKVGQACPTLMHVACIAHLLHNCAMRVCAFSKSIDDVVATIRQQQSKTKIANMIFVKLVCHHLRS